MVQTLSTTALGLALVALGYMLAGFDLAAAAAALEVFFEGLAP